MKTDEVIKLEVKEIGGCNGNMCLCISMPISRGRYEVSVIHALSCVKQRVGIYDRGPGKRNML